MSHTPNFSSSIDCRSHGTDFIKVADFCHSIDKRIKKVAKR